MTIQRLEHFADRLNPMVVKELRQAVRGQAALGLVYGFLATQVIVFGIAAMRLDAQGFVPEAGRGLFQTMAFVMVIALLLGVPIYAGVRTHIERVSEHLTMVQLSGMGFRRIFWGKFLSAMVVNLLILSVMLPFAFTATLLRGIGLPSVAAVSAFTLFCSALCIVGMLSVGCLMVGPIRRILWGLFCAFCFSLMFAFNFGVNTAVIESGVLSVSGWIACPGAGFLLIAGVTLLILYQAAKHRLTGLGDSFYLRNSEYQPWYVKMQTDGQANRTVES